MISLEPPKSRMRFVLLICRHSRSAGEEQSGAASIFNAVMFNFPCALSESLLKRRFYYARGHDTARFNKRAI